MSQLIIVDMTLPVDAVVVTNSVAGRTENPCRVIGHTREHYLIEVDIPTLILQNSSKSRILYPGEKRLVTKSAVKILDQQKDPDIRLSEIQARVDKWFRD